MAAAGPRPLCHTARLALRSSYQKTPRRARIPPPAPLQVVASRARWMSSSDEFPPSTTDIEALDTVGKALGHLGPAEKEPRWRYTPPAMKAPFPLNERLERTEWKVNEDPEVLDEFYARLLGAQWPGMLPEELKWLAVTHKSFDQGRRGFNDRLAYFGRQAIILEVTKNIVAEPPKPGAVTDFHDRVPFEHASLAGLENLNVLSPNDKFSKEKVYKFAMHMRMNKVIRWRPKNTESLTGSGLPTVLTGALQAVVGAVYLQHGAAVASRVLRGKILNKLEGF